MGKIKLTVNEMKHQKDSLRRYQRYLPTLVMKKLYLQIEFNKTSQNLAEKTGAEKALVDEIQEWIAVLGEDAGISDLVAVDAIETETDNVAGVEIPVFKGVRFRETPYDLYTTPPWFDRAITAIRRLLEIKAEVRVLEDQLALVEEELRVTTQRVHLFEKVMIPRTLENIRVIQVFLSDQQTAAVVRGKIAKDKIMKGAAQSAAGESIPQ
jgi:V/A-type H+-transporting ATPase subunit D